MDHCVLCGRLSTFCGKLNKDAECRDCVRERLGDDEEDYEEGADVRFAGIIPLMNYSRQ